MQSLTTPEFDLLRDIVELHEQHGTLTMHGNMKPEERELIASLVLKGMVELRVLTGQTKAFAIPVEQRTVVPTPVGRALVRDERFSGAAEVMAEEGAPC